MKQLDEIKHGKSVPRVLPLSAPSPRQTLLIDRSAFRHRVQPGGRTQQRTQGTHDPSAGTDACLKAIYHFWPLIPQDSES